MYILRAFGIVLRIYAEYALLFILLLVSCFAINIWYITVPLAVIAFIKLNKVVKEREERLNRPCNEIINEVNEVRAKLFKLKRQYDEATTYEDEDFYRNCAEDCRTRLYKLAERARNVETGSLKMHVRITIAGDIYRLINSVGTDFYGRK